MNLFVPTLASRCRLTTVVQCDASIGTRMGLVSLCICILCIFSTTYRWHYECRDSHADNLSAANAVVVLHFVYPDMFLTCRSEPEAAGISACASTSCPLPPSFSRQRSNREQEQRSTGRQVQVQPLLRQLPAMGPCERAEGRGGLGTWELVVGMRREGVWVTWQGERGRGKGKRTGNRLVR